MRAVRAVATVLGLFICSLVAIVAFEDQFIFFPGRAMVATPADRGLAYRDAVFTASDGVRLHGWLVPGREGPTLLWLHGNAGNISHRVDHLALLVEHLGTHVLMVDYRGYGLSEGAPSEQGTYWDAAAALAYLREQPEVDPDGIVVFGQSLGAAVAVHLAAAEAVRGLILEAPFASIRAMAQVALPYVPIGPFLRTRYDSLARIAQVTTPTLILHGSDDEVVPYEQGQAVFAAAAGPKRFYRVVGAGHNDCFLRGGPGYWQAIAEFLDELRETPRKGLTS